jgi:hypothetical protein
VLDHLPSKSKALSSNPSTTKKKKKGKRKEKKEKIIVVLKYISGTCVISSIKNPHH